MTAVPRPSYKGTTSPASRRGGRSHDSPFSPRLTRETLPSPISPLLQIRRNRLSLHRLSPHPPLRMGFKRGKIDHGEMAEWSIAAVLKTVELRGSGGSNPSLSAEKKGCKSLVICTLLLYPPAENIILTNLTTQRRSSIIHHHSLQTNKSLYDNHPDSPPHSFLTFTQYSNA